MKTLLLAAGIGERLGEASANQPKCLLEFAGKTLLQRHLGILRHLGINEIIIITGYRSDLVEREIASTGNDGDIRIVRNPDYCKGSIISMLVGLQELENEPDFFLNSISCPSLTHSFTGSSSCSNSLSSKKQF